MKYIVLLLSILIAVPVAARDLTLDQACQLAVQHAYSVKAATAS